MANYSHLRNHIYYTTSGAIHKYSILHRTDICPVTLQMISSSSLCVCFLSNEYVKNLGT